MCRKYTIVLCNDAQLLPEHLAILSGVRKEKGYRAMAKDLGKSIGMVQQYVDQLAKYKAIVRIPKVSGQKAVWKLTDKGEQICQKNNLTS